MFSENQDIETYLIINKCDLEMSDEEEYFIAGYESIGIKVIRTSAMDDLNIEKLKRVV